MMDALDAYDAIPAAAVEARGCVVKSDPFCESVPSRPRVDTHPLQRKLRWELEAA